MKKRIFALLLSALFVANLGACNQVHENTNDLGNHPPSGSVTDNAPATDDDKNDGNNSENANSSEGNNSNTAPSNPFYSNEELSDAQTLQFISNGDGTCVVKSSYNYTIANVTIPEKSPAGDTVIGIGYAAFSDLNTLESIIIPPTVTKIEAYAFSSCSNLMSIILPDTITSIGECAFSYCERLTSVALPKNLEIIHRSTFEGNISLGNITLSENLSVIDWKAFAGCTSLSNIVLPNTVTKIAEKAFADCTNLEAFTIPKNVVQIGNNPFWGCTKLATLTVDTENTLYRIVNNCLINFESKTVVAVLNNGSIPSTNDVTCIGQYAFGGSELQNVMIPSNITSFQYNIFGRNHDLSIHYNGTVEMWNQIQKHCAWSYFSNNIIYCTDSTIISEAT